MSKNTDSKQYHCTVQDWIDALSKHNRDAVFVINDYFVDTKYITTKSLEWINGKCTWNEGCKSDKIMNAVKINTPHDFMDDFELYYYGELLSRTKEQILSEQITDQKEMLNLVLTRMKGCTRKIYFFPDSNSLVDSNSLDTKGIDGLFEQHEDSFIWISKIPYMDVITFCNDPAQFLVDHIKLKKYYTNT